MKRKLLIAISLLIVAVIAIAANENPVKKFNYSLALNEEVTQVVTGLAPSDENWDGNAKKAFNKEKIKKENSILDIKFEIEPTEGSPEYVKMIAKGNIKVDGENFPFTAKGLVGNLKSNRGDYYHGSLSGEIKNINVKKNMLNENFVLGIDLLPSENKVFVSTNLGAVNEGMSVLFFGESFVDQELSKLVETKN